MKALLILIIKDSLFGKSNKSTIKTTAVKTTAVSNIDLDINRCKLLPTYTLMLLEKREFIKLKDSKNTNNTPNDIASNPKKIKFIKTDAVQLLGILDSVMIM